MKKLNIALVGAGSIAQNFHLPILYRMQDVNIYAVLDKNMSKAKILAEKFDIPHVCKNLDELLSMDEINAVDICASTDAHCEIAVQCLQAGKDVFIEKPVTRTYQEALRIKEAAEKTGRAAMVGVNQRFRHDTVTLKSYVHTGLVGEVFYVRAGWMQQKRGAQWHSQIEKAGGGALMDLGLSLIDSVMWIYDFAPVHSVSASMYYQTTKTVEDVCTAVVRFKNGSSAFFEVSWSLFSNKRDFYCYVHGKKGSAQVNPLQLYKSTGDVFSPVDPGSVMSNFSIHKKSYESELGCFVRAAQGITPVMSSASEAAEIMRIIEAMYQSAREGKEILL